MTKDKLEGCSDERCAMRPADFVHSFDSSEDFQRRVGVVVFCAWNGSRCQDTGIERSTENDTHIPLFAERQESLQSILFKQRVSTRQQKTIEISKPQQPFADLPFVDTRADGSNFPCIPEFLECPISTKVEQLADPLIAGVLATLRECANVMNKEDIGICSLKTRLAIFVGPHHPIVAVVENDLLLRNIDKRFQSDFVMITIQKYSSDFCRENQIVAAELTYCMRQSRLGSAETVLGCCIEITNVRIKGSRQCLHRVIIRNFAIQVSYRRAAETNDTEFDRPVRSIIQESLLHDLHSVNSRHQSRRENAGSVMFGLCRSGNRPSRMPAHRRANTNRVPSPDRSENRLVFLHRYLSLPGCKKQLQSITMYFKGTRSGGASNPLECG